MYIQVYTKHILVYTGLQIENGIWRDILVYTSIYSDIQIQQQYMQGYDVYWSIYNNIQGRAVYILMQIPCRIPRRPSWRRYAGGRSHSVRTRACGGRSCPMPRGRRVFCQARCRRHGRGNWQIFGWAGRPGAQWLRGNAPFLEDPVFKGNQNFSFEMDVDKNGKRLFGGGGECLPLYASIYSFIAIL